MKIDEAIRKVPQKIRMCGMGDVCAFKHHYINQRCFAQFAVRQSCPHIVRHDGSSWAEGSKCERIREI